jgi:cobalt-zinc-cadmium efflux system membrane fusion protein
MNRTQRNRLGAGWGLFALTLAIGTVGCTPGEPKDGAQEEPPAAAEKTEKVGADAVVLEGESLTLAGVEVGTVKEQAISPRIVATGRVEATPSGEVHVTSRVEGRVVKLFATVGDSVRVGQPLAVIESEKLHVAQLAHQLAVKRTELARKNQERQRRLASLGAFASPERDAARTRFNETDAAVRQASGEVEAQRAALNEARGEIAGAQAKIRQAETARDNARRRAERASELLKEELIARQEAEQAEASFKQAEADVEAAKADLTRAEAARSGVEVRLKAAESARAAAQKQREIAARARDRAEKVYQGGYLTSKEVVAAESAYEQAQIEEAGALDDVQLLGGKPGDLHEVPVIAPVAGRVTERAGSLGETVTAERALFHILNADVVWVTLDIFPADVSRLRVGQSVSFTSESLPGRTITGSITSIADVADPKTRTVKVRCRVENPEKRLRPGIFVTGTIATGGFRAVTVPSAAVQEVDGKPVVYVPGKETGQFLPRPVMVGATRDGQTVIESGLKAGEKVVVKNAFVLKSQAMKSELGEE